MACSYVVSIARSQPAVAVLINPIVRYFRACWNARAALSAGAVWRRNGRRPAQCHQQEEYENQCEEFSRFHLVNSFQLPFSTMGRYTNLSVGITRTVSLNQDVSSTIACRVTVYHW